MRGSKIFANSETYLDMRSLPVSRRRREGWAAGEGGRLKREGI